MSSFRCFTLLLLLTLASCAAPVPPAKPTADVFAVLRKDLSADQVIKLLGTPDSIKPFGATDLAAEVWTYRTKVSESVSLAPVGTKELPLTNPITGQMGTTSETVYQNQTLSVIETVDLLMVDRRLIEWKRHRSTESAFH